MAASRYFADKVNKMSTAEVVESTSPAAAKKARLGDRSANRFDEVVAGTMTNRGAKTSGASLTAEARAIRVSPKSLVPGALFCAPSPAKYRCRVKSTCVECFSASLDCQHHGDAPLKLLLLGHNPSSHVWIHGYNYGQPSNKMWRLLSGDFPDYGSFQGCLPSNSPIEDQNEMPTKLGVGFIEVAPVPGSDAAAFSDAFMRSWVPNLFQRLRAHVHRVRASCDPSYEGPRMVAFTGKRQFQMLFPSKASEPKEFIPFGRVPFSLMPPEWPFPESTQVWVLTSSSGRAAMSNEKRAEPYRNLAEEFHKVHTRIDGDSSTDQ